MSSLTTDSADKIKSKRIYNNNIGAQKEKVATVFESGAMFFVSRNQIIENQSGEGLGDENVLTDLDQQILNLPDEFKSQLLSNKCE